MAATLKSSNALAPNCKMLVMIDPNTGQLVDLARSGVTFTLDAGAIILDDTIGKVLRVGGSIDGGTGSVIHQGVAWTPLTINNTQVKDFVGTLFCVFSKWTGDDGGAIASYKLNTPFANQVSNFPMPGFTNVGNSPSRRLALMKDNTEISTSVAMMSSGSLFGDGLRHSIAVVASNPAGGWSAVQGKLYLDGADTGVAVTQGVGGTAVFGGFGKLPNSLWKGDFVLMAYFDKALSPAEIASLHASIGNGGQFGLVEGVSAPAAPTGTVTIGTVTPSSTGVTVGYTYSGADATGYQYRLNGGTATSLGASPATISGLTASTAYTLEVRATNANGQGAWSAVSNFTTSAPVGDSTVPTMTGSLSFTSISSVGYSVSWAAASDNVAVTGYEVQVGSGGWSNVGNVLTTSITGRTAGTTDTVQVRAYDAAGNRSSALSKSVTLLASVTASLVITEPLTIAGLPAAGLTGISAVVVQSSDLTYVCKLSGLTTDSSGRIQGLTHASMVVGMKYDVYFKHLANKNRGHKVEVTAS